MNTTAEAPNKAAPAGAATEETVVRDYRFGDCAMTLETSGTVFQPTLTSRLLAQLVQIPEGGSVLDLGCGVGVLAIVAALKGAARVQAVDVMAEACRLALANARRNGVRDRVEATPGDLFEPVKGRRFDVVISDVSGVVDEVSRLSPWYPDSIPTGGHDGADQIVRMLEAAPDHLRPGGSLYFPTGTISNVSRTLDAARKAFGPNVELLEQVEVPFCTEFRENMDVMTRLRDEGLIDFGSKRSRYLWTLQMYRAWV